jgi:hypothetical protein
MQKTIFIIGRLWFVTTALLLLVVLCVGEILIINQSKGGGNLAQKVVGGDGVVLAVSSDGGEEKIENRVETALVTDDARPLLIKRYLEKYQSPLAPYSEMIFQLSQTYGFDYYWIVAIAQQESNLCKKIPENSYNCWGYGINSTGTLRFDSYELALQSYAEYLKRAYFDKGLNTPELIMKKYCPHSNGSWAFGVQHFIDELESGKF